MALALFGILFLLSLTKHYIDWSKTAIDHPSNMTFFTLNQAAKETKRAKSTILNAIKVGRLSAPKDDLGNYKIDAAELFRVYPLEPSNTFNWGRKTAIEHKNVHRRTPVEAALLLQKMEFLEHRVSNLEKENDYVKNRLEQSEKERREAQEKLTALLIYQPISQNEPHSVRNKDNLLWNKLFGKKRK